MPFEIRLSRTPTTRSARNFLAMVRVTVAGAAGYIGGELLRLLLGHPEIEVVGAVSSRFPGKRIDSVHPNLRSVTDLSFCAAEEVAGKRCGLLGAAAPGGDDADRPVAERSKLVIDMTGDFRLDDTDVFERYYGEEHQAPHLLDEFTPGLPELYRDRLRTADLISVPGCMATAGVLALYPWWRTI